ncbi:MAG: hypothetical protein AUI08_07345 [Gemmatimonadetes bacterium 13_2_20CM_2_65_7]|nr:MAG: hypothetical protein AUI08_07345 [Gemmatimonadetes bacterium 13_2_20CM_2_65_7]
MTEDDESSLPGYFNLRQEYCVHVRHLLTLAAAVAASATSVSTLEAQAPAAPPPAPQVTVSGVVYGQYQYDLKDSVGAAGVNLGKQNQFSIKRAYVNVIGRFAGGLQTRITADIAPSGTTNQIFRLKYAYAAWTPEGSSLTYKLGLLHTPWLDWEEALWDYRMQGTMATERGGYTTSADFGAGIDGKWNNDQVNGQLTLVNGEGYSGGTGDKRKDVQLRLSVRVMNTDDASRVGGLRLSGYAGIGKVTGGGDRNRFIGLASYRSKQFTLAGEFASTKDTVSPVGADSLNLGGGPSATGRILSAFGVVHLPDSKVSAIARVDVIDPNTSTSPNKLTRFIGGVSYQVNANLRMLADVDLLSFEATPRNQTTATRQQGLVQMQFTF